MKRYVAILFLLLLAGQAFVKVGYIAYWKLNQQRITQAYCENKARPALHCNGKCHLRKQLRKMAGADAGDRQGPRQGVPEEIDVYLIWQDKFALRFYIEPLSRSFTTSVAASPLNGYPGSLLRPPATALQATCSHLTRGNNRRGFMSFNAI